MIELSKVIITKFSHLEAKVKASEIEYNKEVKNAN